MDETDTKSPGNAGDIGTKHSGNISPDPSPVWLITQNGRPCSLSPSTSRETAEDACRYWNAQYPKNAPHVAVRYVAGELERLAKLAEELLSLLPMCEQFGCHEPVTHSWAPSPHDIAGLYCDAHRVLTSSIPDTKLPWADAAAALAEAIEDDALESAVAGVG